MIVVVVNDDYVDVVVVVYMMFASKVQPEYFFMCVFVCVLKHMISCNNRTSNCLYIPGYHGRSYGKSAGKYCFPVYFNGGLINKLSHTK